MRSFISAVAVVALTPVVFAQGPKINTVMNPTQCEPLQFTWQGGVPPYYLSLVPGGQPGAQPLKQFPAQSGDSMTWVVDLGSGTTFSSSLRDSTGQQAFSDIQTVQQGPDSSCLNGGSSTTTMPMTGTTGTNSDTSAASTETATTASVPAGAQKIISTTATSASATITGTVAHAASSASTTTATATSSNAASLHTSVGAIGFAGLLGLVGAALLG